MINIYLSIVLISAEVFMKPPGATRVLLHKKSNLKFNKILIKSLLVPLWSVRLLHFQKSLDMLCLNPILRFFRFGRFLLHIITVLFGESINVYLVCHHFTPGNGTVYDLVAADRPYMSLEQNRSSLRPESILLSRNAKLKRLLELLRAWNVWGCLLKRLESQISSYIV